jgi:hypothetical protein
VTKKVYLMYTNILPHSVQKKSQWRNNLFLFVLFHNFIIQKNLKNMAICKSLHERQRDFAQLVTGETGKMYSTSCSMDVIKTRVSSKPS